MGRIEPTALNPATQPDEQILAQPPELKPLSRDPINGLKMTNDARVVYETIAKLAGLSVIFDPDFTSRRITVDFPSVTLEQALDAVSLESKAFWKPITSNIIFVAQDQPQKRKDLEDEVVQTFYLSNTLTPQDLTEVVNGLRVLLDLHRLQQVNAQNAIVIRDTPDKLLLAAKIIRDIDKAKPEVLIHVQVLTASMDRLRDLGILPGQTVSLAFTPRSSIQPQTSTSTIDDSLRRPSTHPAGPVEPVEESGDFGLGADFAGGDGERDSYGRPHQDYSGSGIAGDGWAEGHAEDWIEGAGGDGQLPGWSRRGRDGKFRRGEPPGEHAIPIH